MKQERPDVGGICVSLLGISCLMVEVMKNQRECMQECWGQMHTSLDHFSGLVEDGFGVGVVLLRTEDRPSNQETAGQLRHMNQSSSNKGSSRESAQRNIWAVGYVAKPSITRFKLGRRERVKDDLRVSILVTKILEVLQRLQKEDNGFGEERTI